MREIGRIKRISPEEDLALAKRVQAGDEQARQDMIKANLRLVVKIAREYEHCGLPLLDLISEGNIGLMKAVERFDPARGARLSTYAALWIKQAIRNALAKQSKTIRLPAYLTSSISMLRKASQHLHATLGGEPTSEELAEKTGVPLSRVRKLRQTPAQVSSIDEPVLGEGDSHQLGDLIEDEQAVSPYEVLVKKTDERTLSGLLRKLPERQAMILRLRFGLNGREPMTLETIGEKFGVTRERIRQLESMALKRLGVEWPNGRNQRKR